MGRTTRMAEDGPRWVWSAEVMEVIDREMFRRGLSLGELARRAGERYAIDPESAERRLRSARRSDAVMDVHTADRYLVLVGRHILDIPCYRRAVIGELPPDRWPRRGAARPGELSDARFAQADARDDHLPLGLGQARQATANLRQG